VPIATLETVRPHGKSSSLLSFAGPVYARSGTRVTRSKAIEVAPSGRRTSVRSLAFLTPVTLRLSETGHLNDVPRCKVRQECARPGSRKGVRDCCQLALSTKRHVRVNLFGSHKSLAGNLTLFPLGRRFPIDPEPLTRAFIILPLTIFCGCSTDHVHRCDSWGKAMLSMPNEYVRHTSVRDTLVVHVILIILAGVAGII
jgi:hypothetical protein